MPDSLQPRQPEALVRWGGGQHERQEPGWGEGDEQSFASASPAGGCVRQSQRLPAALPAPPVVRDVPRALPRRTTCRGIPRRGWLRASQKLEREDKQRPKWMWGGGKRRAMGADSGRRVLLKKRGTESWERKRSLTLDASLSTATRLADQHSLDEQVLQLPYLHRIAEGWATRWRGVPSASFNASARHSAQFVPSLSLSEKATVCGALVGPDWPFDCHHGILRCSPCSPEQEENAWWRTERGGVNWRAEHMHAVVSTANALHDIGISWPRGESIRTRMLAVPNHVH